MSNERSHPMTQLSDALAAAKGQAPAPLTGYCINHAMPVTSGDLCPDSPDAEGGITTRCGVGCMDWRNEKPADHDATAIAEEQAARRAEVEEMVGEMEGVAGACRAMKRITWAGAYCEQHEAPCAAGNCVQWVQPIPSQSVAKEPERSCDTCKHHGLTCVSYDDDDLKCGRGLPLWNTPGYDRANAEAKARLEAKAKLETNAPEPTRDITVYILTPETVKAPETDPAMAALMRLAEDVPNTQNHLDLITIAEALGEARGEARRGWMR